MALALRRPGVIRNPRSHGNRGGAAAAPSGVAWAEPDSPQALGRELDRFAREGVDLLIIAGGDGTVRDVLSALPAAYGASPPVVAVLPAGKTNILALDLGSPRGWTLEAALVQASRDEPATKTRTPLEIHWASRAPVRGFFLGLGAFVRATELAQSVHRAGFFHSLGVAVTLSGAAAGALMGGQDNPWRQGVHLALGLDGDAPKPGYRLLTMLTTLKRLPLGLAPFGPPREGMKVLDIDAPPRRLHAALPKLLAGRDAAWLEPAGYRRLDAICASIVTEGAAVIDGEIFPGGAMEVRRGDPLLFLAP